MWYNRSIRRTVMKVNCNLTGKGGDFLTFTQKDKNIETIVSVRAEDIYYIDKTNIGNEICYTIKVKNSILLISKEDYEQLLNYLMGAEK